MSVTRRRFRDLGLSIGTIATGPNNAITDVKGVEVGHTTLISGEGRLRRGKGPVRTGVTAIHPGGRDVYMKRVIGGGFVLNGAGEMSGLMQVLEWGLIETPILLTNTLSLGTCNQALARYMVERYPGIGTEMDVVLPLVGECDDSWLNDIAGRHVTMEHVVQALADARGGPVAEGNVGGGTGMMTCDFSGGIGTSSRKLAGRHGGYTVGVLVMSNFGRMVDFRADGLPVGRILAPRYAEHRTRTKSYGSIIAVVATDAPLLTHQLNRLCKRAALGIGRVGSHAAHGSGEIILGFSTTNTVERTSRRRTHTLTFLSDEHVNPLYQAVIDATEEAILNAICMGDTLEGVNRHVAVGLPLEDVQHISKKLSEVG